jgi:hypothetical protein
VALWGDSYLLSRGWSSFSSDIDGDSDKGSSSIENILVDLCRTKSKIKWVLVKVKPEDGTVLDFDSIAVCNKIGKLL